MPTYVTSGIVSVPPAPLARQYGQGAGRPCYRARGGTTGGGASRRLGRRVRGIAATRHGVRALNPKPLLAIDKKWPGSAREEM